MLQISSTNGVVGYTETLDYCYKLSSGSAQVIGRKEKARGKIPTGIIFQGKIYNLPQHDDFDADTAYISEVDTVSVLNAQRDIIKQHESVEADLDALTIDHELSIMDLKLGIDEDE